MASVVGRDRAEISVARRAVQERQQDQDAEQAADDDGVANVVDGVVDEPRLVVNNRGLNIFGNMLLFQELAQFIGNADGVAAEPAKDRDHDSFTQVHADRIDAVLVGDLDIGDVFNLDGLAILQLDPQIGNILGRFDLIGDHQLKSERLAFDPADRFQAMHLADFVGQVGGGESGQHQIVGAGLNLDLADFAAADVGVEHVLDLVLDLRCELVISVVAQLGWAIPAGEHHRNDRIHGRRHLFDLDLDAGRQFRSGSADAVPDILQRLLDVGAGVEVDGYIHAAANGLAANARYAQHCADGLFQRTGDENLHLDHIEARLLGDDGDAWKGHFRINAAGHARGEVNSTGGKQSNRKHDGSQIRSGSGSDVEHLVLNVYEIILVQTVTALHNDVCSLHRHFLVLRVFQLQDFHDTHWTLRMTDRAAHTQLGRQDSRLVRLVAFLVPALHGDHHPGRILVFHHGAFGNRQPFFRFLRLNLHIDNLVGLQGQGGSIGNKCRSRKKRPNCQGRPRTTRNACTKK